MRPAVTLRSTRPIVRTLAIWAATAAVAGFVVASVASYRPGRITDRTLAVTSLKRALAALDDEALDSAARLVAYREGVRRSDAQLRRAIEANPADTASIERLAMVRWESGVLTGTPDIDSVLSLVAIAAARAPRVPEIQADIGTLLYKMGIPTKGAPFMRRAVELSPAMTNRVVTAMHDAGVEAEAIAATLPNTAGVLVALRESLAQSAHIEEWLLRAETLLPDNPGELLWSYADACLSANAPDRLIEHIERLGVLGETRDEVKRQIAIARAQLAREAWGPALSATARARALAPEDWPMLEYAAQLTLAAGDTVQAEAAFREALRALALEGRTGVIRARLYRQHGQALERLGRVDDAFDEYRRAVEILPDDPWLRQRFQGSSPKPLNEGLP